MTCKPYEKIKSIIQNDNLIYRKKNSKIQINFFERNIFKGNL